MKTTANIPFPTTEAVIANGAMDDTLGRKQGHDRRVVEKHVGAQPVPAAASVAPIPVGEVVSETARVKDTSAGFLQRQLGFDTWEHTRKITKVASQDAIVIDKLKWPKNHSTAVRTFEVVGKPGNATKVAAQSWKVNVEGVPGAKKVAAKMEAKMHETDETLPEILQDAARAAAKSKK